MLKNTEQSVSFVADGLHLSGVLHLPKREPLAVVIGCHGLMADKNSPKQIALARGCTATGMAYFRFDHRGCGDSEGVFETDTTLEKRTSDLTAAVHAVNHTLGKTMPIGLFGSSLGGTVCLTAAQNLSPFAVVTLAAPVQSRSIQIPDDSPESLKNELVDNRLAFNATAALGGTREALRSFTVDAGVDVVSFGGTKNGLLGAEAVVFLNPTVAIGSEFTRKQVTQLPSKMRYLAAQFTALLRDDLWIELAAHANTMAQELFALVSEIDGIDAGPSPQVNSLFPTLDPGAIGPLRDWCFFWDWDADAHQVRWMTAWDTTIEDVETFAQGVATMIAGQKRPN